VEKNRPFLILQGFILLVVFLFFQFFPLSIPEVVASEKIPFFRDSGDFDEIQHFLQRGQFVTVERQLNNFLSVKTGNDEKRITARLLLANLYVLTGDYNKADNNLYLLQEELRQKDLNKGVWKAYLLREAGRLSQSRQQHVMARKYLEAAYLFFKRYYGKDSPDTIISQIFLLEVYNDLGIDENQLHDLAQRLEKKRQYGLAGIAYLALARSTRFENDIQRIAVNQAAAILEKNGACLYFNKAEIDLVRLTCAGGSGKDHKVLQYIEDMKVLLGQYRDAEFNKGRMIRRKIKDSVMLALDNNSIGNDSHKFELAQIVNLSTVSNTIFLRRNFFVDKSTGAVPWRSLDETKRNLKKGEGIFLFLVGRSRGLGSFSDSVYVFFIKQDSHRFYKCSMDAGWLREYVKNISNSLRGDNIRLFPVSDAHKLFRALFGPAIELAGDLHTLFIVDDGVLQNIPMSILVSKPLQDGELYDYRKISWLIRDYALVTLPNVSSLNSQSSVSKPDQKASIRFVGFGNPTFGAPVRSMRSIMVTGLYDTQGNVLLERLRQLPSLPESETELHQIAEYLGVGNSSVFCGEEANEDTVKSFNFSSADIISFATHGLMAGELCGVKEPALILTPPGIVSKTNDGLLRASEVANLKLRTDLVMLSACNTAATDGKDDSVGLSGLAQSFFHAGAKNVVVSHWPVVSDAAVLLMTGMMEHYVNMSYGDYGQALRKSMLKAMERYPSPVYWAPFVLVKGG